MGFAEHAAAAVGNFRPARPGDQGARVDRFHRDYAVVLRAVLFAVDRHQARQVTGIPAEERRP
jgi:hypothetical protein